MGVQIRFYFLWMILRSGISISYGSSIFIYFFSILHIVFHNNCINLHSHNVA